MKVQGMVNPGSFTVEEIPGTKRSLVRLYQNVEACKIAKDAEDKEGLDGFQYDEYCVEVESWPGLAASVRENYDTYLAKGKDNEVDRSNDALFRAQKNTDSIVQDTDAMSVDHEYRLTLLEGMVHVLVSVNQTNGLEEKIDIFFAAGKLTESEYQELIAMLKAE